MSSFCLTSLSIQLHASKHSEVLVVLIEYDSWGRCLLALTALMRNPGGGYRLECCLGTVRWLLFVLLAQRQKEESFPELNGCSGFFSRFFVFVPDPPWQDNVSIPGFSALLSHFSIFVSRFSLLGFRFSFLDSGFSSFRFWTLDPRFSLLGILILVFGS